MGRLMTMYLYFFYNTTHMYLCMHVLSPQQVGIPLRSPETSQIKQETTFEPPIIYWTILHMCGHDNIAHNALHNSVYYIQAFSMHQI